MIVMPMESILALRDFPIIGANIAAGSGAGIDAITGFLRI